MIKAPMRQLWSFAWPVELPHRLFDGRAEHLGPYYVGFGIRTARCLFDPEGVLQNARVKNPREILQYGLEQHARWQRTCDERARERFLAQARWAAGAQRKAGGVRGSYVFPRRSEKYGCDAGFRSAAAQGQAISLLLRAFEETEEIVYLERAIDAAMPLTVDVREGGVLWRSGTDVFFEAVAGQEPSHILYGWIFALWGLFELTRFAKIPSLERLYRDSLATLEKYLPCYDARKWSYESLLAAPSGFRRFAGLRCHLLHVAQLHVLLSMTRNQLFAVVAERWRRYAESFDGRFHVWANAVPSAMVWDTLTVPGGARSVI
jgi:heparosan-N-sulfate-glucuronate 5-epimerase